MFIYHLVNMCLINDAKRVELDISTNVMIRRPGQSRLVSPRKETDTCQIYSGIAEG